MHFLVNLAVVECWNLHFHFPHDSLKSTKISPSGFFKVWLVVTPSRLVTSRRAGNAGRKEEEQPRWRSWWTSDAPFVGLTLIPSYEPNITSVVLVHGIPQVFTLRYIVLISGFSSTNLEFATTLWVTRRAREAPNKMAARSPHSVKV